MIKSFNGKTPRIAASAWVSEAAYIIGDVEIGENSGIWPGAVVRGDFAPIKIGSNTNIEDGSVVHGGSPLELGDNIIVGHGAVVHCAKVGNYTLIGNNAVVLNNAEIGDFCIIGSGCVVSEWMRIPSNSLVLGVPGKIRGEVTQERLQWIKDGVKDYTEMTRKYKEQGL